MMSDIRMPRLPKGWTWDLDRTSDVVAVSIDDSRGWTLAGAVLLGRPFRFWLGIVGVLAHAYWTVLAVRTVGGRITYARARVAVWREKRRAIRQDRYQSFSASVNGRYDHTGRRMVAEAVGIPALASSCSTKEEK